MLEGYRQAAAYAAEGGLDGVEVCAGFGYLPTQFLSRHANVRTDEYGGSFENRFRFLREVLEAMRDGFGPNGAVGCRLTDERTSAVGTDFDDILAAAEAVGARRAGRLRLGHARLVDHVSGVDVDRAAVSGGRERDRRSSRRP